MLNEILCIQKESREDAYSEEDSSYISVKVHENRLRWNYTMTDVHTQVSNCASESPYLFSCFHFYLETIHFFFSQIYRKVNRKKNYMVQL
jgi:hypothetical protein